MGRQRGTIAAATSLRANRHAGEASRRPILGRARSTPSCRGPFAPALTTWPWRSGSFGSFARGVTPAGESGILMAFQVVLPKQTPGARVTGVACCWRGFGSAARGHAPGIRCGHRLPPTRPEFTWPAAADTPFIHPTHRPGSARPVLDTVRPVPVGWDSSRGTSIATHSQERRLVMERYRCRGASEKRGGMPLGQSWFGV